MSVDGFIAGPGGDMSWLADYIGGPNDAVDALVPQIGALLVGRRTYGGDDPFKGTPTEGEAYGGSWHGPQVVLTHHPPEEQVEGVTFVTAFADAIAESSRAAGDRYVSILGADVAAQCVRAGVLDEVLVTIVPILLGGGVRLFESPDAVPLEMIECTYQAPFTNLWSRVIRR